jgi:predicted RNase H-like HicB family nuclease
MKYRVVYEREPDGRWTVEVPDVPGCHTYGRTIDQARERLREALSLFTDGAEKAQFAEHIKLPGDALRTIRVAKDLREMVSREEARMVTAQIKAVQVLRNRLKLGHRDAGALLGLSHQRVQQLEQRAYRAGKGHGGILTDVDRTARRHPVKTAAKKR